MLSFAISLKGDSATVMPGLPPEHQDFDDFTEARPEVSQQFGSHLGVHPLLWGAFCRPKQVVGQMILDTDDSNVTCLYLCPCVMFPTFYFSSICSHIVIKVGFLS